MGVLYTSSLINWPLWRGSALLLPWPLWRGGCCREAKIRVKDGRCTEVAVGMEVRLLLHH